MEYSDHVTPAGPCGTLLPLDYTGSDCDRIRFRGGEEPQTAWHPVVLGKLVHFPSRVENCQRISKFCASIFGLALAFVCVCV